MWPFEYLKVENSDWKAAQNLLLSSPNDPNYANKVLKSLAFKPDYAHHDYEAYYLFFRAYVNKSSEHVEHRKGIDKAVRMFRRMGDPWNEAMAHWFLGLLCQGKGDVDTAKNELADAKKILKHILKESEHYGNYDQENLCKKFLEKIDETVDIIVTSESKIKDLATSPYDTESIIANESYIMFPVFPIYGYATAGPDGRPVLDSPDYACAIDEAGIIKLNGKKYKIDSITKGDRQITITLDDFRASVLPNDGWGGKKYGWLKVIGNSMENAGINPDDYILFYENHDFSFCVGKIVVALLPGETRLVIKRLIYDRGRYTLRSESQDDYVDIKVTEQCQLSGVVAATAKPIS